MTVAELTELRAAFGELMAPSAACAAAIRATPGSAR